MILLILFDFFLATTTLRAIPNILPASFPLFSPRKKPSTNNTFLLQILVVHMIEVVSNRKRTVAPPVLQCDSYHFVYQRSRYSASFFAPDLGA